jgi:hypothetical protein
MRAPACLIAAALLGPASARAQGQGQSDDDKELARLLEEEVYVAELRAPGRLVIGFDFGIGFIDATCGGCYPRGGLSLDGFAGVQVARRVALLADVWTINHLVARDDQSQESGIAIHSLDTAAARVWIIPRLWVQAGGGLGWFNITADRDGFLFGPAAMIAVGGEPGHKRCRGTDLSLRIGGTRVRDDSEDSAGHMLIYSATAVVGFHWN